MIGACPRIALYDERGNRFVRPLVYALVICIVREHIAAYRRASTHDHFETLSRGEHQRFLVEPRRAKRGTVISDDVESVTFQPQHVERRCRRIEQRPHLRLPWTNANVRHELAIDD